MSSAATHRFCATIYRQGILRCVDVPSEVAEAFADWTYPPVVVTVAGVSRATMLLAAAGGGFRLFLNDQLRRAGGVDTGDMVQIELHRDDEPQLRMPDEVVNAAEGIERGLEALELLPAGLRREMLRFVLDAKSSEARHKRVARVAELLEERAQKLPDPED